MSAPTRQLNRAAATLPDVDLRALADEKRGSAGATMFCSHMQRRLAQTLSVDTCAALDEKTASVAVARTSLDSHGKHRAQTLSWCRGASHYYRTQQK